MELKRMKDKVEWELENYPPTRSSDRELIRRIYKDFYQVGNNAFWVDVLLNTDLPNFESIRRCRQKIQEERIDLRAVEPVETERINKQLEFIEFAQGDM